MLTVNSDSNNCVINFDFNNRKREDLKFSEIAEYSLQQYENFYRDYKPGKHEIELVLPKQTKKVLWNRLSGMEQYYYMPAPNGNNMVLRTDLLAKQEFCANTYIVDPRFYVIINRAFQGIDYSSLGFWMKSINDRPEIRVWVSPHHAKDYAFSKIEGVILCYLKRA